MIYTDNMILRAFMVSVRFPCLQQQTLGLMWGSDDKNLTESDEEYLPQLQRCDSDEDRDESRDSRKI